MKTQKPKNWLVLFQPKGSITVDTMKVIDAWSSTNGTITDAKKSMNRKAGEYASKYGNGSVRVVLDTGAVGLGVVPVKVAS